MRKLVLALVLAAIAFAPVGAQQSVPEPKVALPNKDGSFKFAVLGSSGTGEPAQYQLAEQMVNLHNQFKYDLVLLAGGNLPGAERPPDYQKRFELPYKRLLDAGVTFHASLGRDDDVNQRDYKLFNMGGKQYYTFSPNPDVTFFALDSNYLSPDQLEWLETELQASRAAWKIAFLHHPLYSSGDRQESQSGLRNTLEPLLVKYNVAVVLSGQGGFYERLKPQKGIAHFVVGSGGQLNPGRLDMSSGITGKGFDSDQAFMAAEIIGDEMYFIAMSRAGKIVDAGIVHRR
ncbi:MAG TPA: metallophosphoesterase [Vicinamibacterales bacterium]|nr:metallophosphoesterase [Vicinamibacterales bacterium]